MKCRPHYVAPNKQVYSPSPQVQGYRLPERDKYDVNLCVAHGTQSIDEITEAEIHPLGFTFGFTFMGTMAKARVGRIWNFLDSMIYHADLRLQDRARLEEMKYFSSQMEWKFDPSELPPTSGLGASGLSLPAPPHPPASNANYSAADDSANWSTAVYCGLLAANYSYPA